MGQLFSVQSKQAEGGLGMVNYQEQLMEIMGGSNRVELRLAAKNVPKKDKLSKSDPMAVLFRSPATGQTTWIPVCRTEAQVNSVNPAWVRPLLSAYNPQAQQPVKIVIYDVDRLKDGDTRKINLDSQDYIGEAEFLISDVMSAPNQTLELELVDMVNGRALPPGCTVVIRGEQMAPADNRVVRMGFAARAIPKRDKMSESDPFLQCLKLRRIPGMTGEDWIPVFKTEVRDNNPDPIWRPIEVDIRQLCSADEDRPLKLQVWDYNDSGSHQLIGEVVTSLTAMRAMAPGTYVAPSYSLEGGKEQIQAQVTNALGAVAASAAQHAGKTGAGAGADAGAGTTASRAAPAPGAATGGSSDFSAVPLGGADGDGAVGSGSVAGRTLELQAPPPLNAKVGSLTLRMVQVRPGPTPGQALAGCLYQLPGVQKCLGMAGVETGKAG